MKTETHGEQTKVILVNYTGFRAGMLFSFEGIIYSCGFLLMLFAGVAVFSNDMYFPALLALAAAIIFGIAAYRYLERVTLHEELWISPDMLTTIITKNGRKVSTQFPLDALLSLRFIGFQEAADHPLKSPNFDYLGFQTQQAVVNTVTAEGNLLIEHAASSVRIGKGMPSWDAAKLNALIAEKTNGQAFIEGLPEEIPEELWQAR